LAVANSADAVEVAGRELFRSLCVIQGGGKNPGEKASTKLSEFSVCSFRRNTNDEITVVRRITQGGAAASGQSIPLGEGT